MTRRPAHLVGIDDGFQGRLRRHKGVQGRLISALDYLGGNLVSGAVLRAEHGGLADCSAAGQLPALRPRHVGAATAHVRIVYLNRASEGRGGIAECFPDTVCEEPCGLLGDLQVAVQLHAALSFQGRGEEVDCDYPYLIAKGRTLHRGGYADAEPLAAFTLGAPPRHRLVIVAPDIERATVQTPRLAAPPLFLKPCLCRIVIGKHAEQLDEGHSFAVCFAWCFLCHRVFLSHPYGERSYHSLGNEVYNPLFLYNNCYTL